MNKEKQIEEMAKVIEQARIKATDTTNSMNYGFGGWYAKELYVKGYRRASDVAEEIFAEIDDFQRKLRHIFLGMCGGNDYNTLNLLQIDNAIESLFDSHIAKLKKKYTKGDKEI